MSQIKIRCVVENWALVLDDPASTDEDVDAILSHAATHSTYTFPEPTTVLWCVEYAYIHTYIHFITIGKERGQTGILRGK